MKRIVILVTLVLPGLLFAQDSLNMRTVSIWPYGPGKALDIARISGHKYVVLGSGGGIMMINVDDPAKPIKTGELATAGMVEGIKVIGNLAYVADGDQGLAIINIKKPRRPALISSIRTKDYAKGIDVADGYAYVADRDSGICIIDVKNPARTETLGNVSTPAKVAKVKIRGKYLISLETPVWGHYVVGFVKTDGGVRVFDRTDPIKLKELKYYKTFFDDNNYSFVNVAFRSDSVYFHGGLGKITYFPLDCTQDSLTTIQGDYGIMGSGSGYIGLWGNYSLDFRTEDSFLLEIVGDSILSQQQTAIDYAPRDAVYADSLLYLVKNDLDIFDVRKPIGKQLVGKYALPGYSIKTTKIGNHLFLLHEQGLVIFDVQNPNSPVVLSEVSCGERNRSLAISGGYAYIGEGFRDVKYIDVRDARHPRFLGPVKDSRKCDALAVSGPTCFAINYDTWQIDAFEIAHAPDIQKIETADPLKHSSGEVLRYSNGLLVMGLAYVDSGDIIKIIDASDRAKLKFIAGWGIPDTCIVIHYESDTTGPFKHVIGLARDLQSAQEEIKNTKDTLSYELYRKDINDIACAGDTIYVVSENKWGNNNFPDKLRVFEFKRPDTLRMISGKGFPCWGTSIAVSDKSIYVADVDSGICVLDASDVRDIKNVAHYNRKEKSFSSVSYDKGYIYATDYNGFRVLQVKNSNYK